MKKKTELLKKIKKSLSQLSEEKYDHIKEWKYIWFAKDGEFGGPCHFKLNLVETPLERAEPLFYLTPMASKKAMLAALQEMIDQPLQTSIITDKKGFLSLEEIQNHLFGPHADEYNRLFKFFEIEGKIETKNYSAALRNIYHDSVKKYLYRNELRRAFKKAPQDKLMMMEEQYILNSLGDPVTIYRAMSSKENEMEDYGVSWTLYENIAFEVGRQGYGGFWNQAGFLTKKLEVPRADLYALFQTRNMWEIVYVQQEIPPQAMVVDLS